MEGGDEGRRDSVVLVVIVVLAALAVSSLLVAFSYYCYIRSKVARHRKSLKSELPGSQSHCSHIELEKIEGMKRKRVAFSFTSTPFFFPPQSPSSTKSV